jgi:hypothetical protein
MAKLGKNEEWAVSAEQDEQGNVILRATHEVHPAESVVVTFYDNYTVGKAFSEAYATLKYKVDEVEARVDFNQAVKTTIDAINSGGELPEE